MSAQVEIRAKVASGDESSAVEKKEEPPDDLTTELEDGVQSSEEEEEEEEEDDDESSACQDDDEEESSVYDEDEEEAKYADQPGCGLSPRLVIKRGVEALQEDERRQREQQGEPSYPVLQRVDTVAGFEHAVDRCDLADVLVSSPRLPKVERVASMSGLPAVADAFEAVEAEAATNAPSCNAADAASKPDPVRRMDTLELLQNPVDNSSEATAEFQSTKRQRLVA